MRSIGKRLVRVAVVGSRTITDYNYIKRKLDSINISKIISGGAMGVDSCAARYARDHNISLWEIKPEWDKFGKGAGFIRNKDIVHNADIILAFWDGKSKGTKHTIDYAKKVRKEVFVFTQKNKESWNEARYNDDK